MRKDELVYLHALCATLRRHFEDDETLPDPELERYGRVDVSPMAVHRQKAAHRDGVQRLLTDLTSTVRPQEETVDIDSGSQYSSSVDD
jgi:hypothetical protein